jgi:hypothetical protein
VYQERGAGGILPDVTSESTGMRVSGPELRRARRLWVLLGTAAVFVIGVARALVPDPSGLGTHAQLGLPPCVFHALTSWPCPACGLTTSFAHMARWDVAAAVASHSLGAPLFFVTIAVVPLSVAGTACGWPFGATWRSWRLPRALLWAAAAFLVAWVVRVATRLFG